MAGWKITISNGRYIFIQGPFSSQRVVRLLECSLLEFQTPRVALLSPPEEGRPDVGLATPVLDTYPPPNTTGCRLFTEDNRLTAISMCTTFDENEIKIDIIYEYLCTCIYIYKYVCAYTLYTCMMYSIFLVDLYLYRAYSSFFGGGMRSCWVKCKFQLAINLEMILLDLLVWWLEKIIPKWW